MEKEYSYKDIWEHQTTIMYIANYRFKALKYLKQEYDNNNHATFSRFIRETMYTFREVVIMDLSKLFIEPYLNGNDDSKRYKGKNSRLNFYYNIHKYRTEIGQETFDIIESLLISVQDKVNQLITVRNKEIGHKDLKHSENHTLHINDLDIIEELIVVGKSIITLYSEDYYFDELYSDDYSNPNWISDVLEAINFKNNDRPEIKYINSLKAGK
jgi:hypothetical protein